MCATIYDYELMQKNLAGTFDSVFSQMDELKRISESFDRLGAKMAYALTGINEHSWYVSNQFQELAINMAKLIGYTDSFKVNCGSIRTAASALSELCNSAYLQSDSFQSLGDLMVAGSEVFSDIAIDDLDAELSEQDNETFSKIVEDATRLSRDVSEAASDKLVGQPTKPHEGQQCTQDAPVNINISINVNTDSEKKRTWQDVVLLFNILIPMLIFCYSPEGQAFRKDVNTVFQRVVNFIDYCISQPSQEFEQGE